MRRLTLWPGAVCATLLACGNVRAQAFRYVPLPGPPAGGGFHAPVHLPWHGGGEEFFPIIVAVVGVGLALVVGWNLGRALGGGRTRSPQAREEGWQQGTTRPVPPPDLVLGPAEVQDKARGHAGTESVRRPAAGENPHARRPEIGMTRCI
jgi:hypothetical protein